MQKRKPFYKFGRFYNNSVEGKKHTNQTYWKTVCYLVRSLIKELSIFIASITSNKRLVPARKKLWLATPRKAPPVSFGSSITWIGHATFLIETVHGNILTDPILGSPSIFFPRLLPPGIAPEQLPRIDYILLSHNHPDHMDTKSLTRILSHNPHCTVFVPEGDQFWFAKRGYHVMSNTWWESHNFGDLTFTFLPAHHWSQRGLFDKNRSLWGSWMIETTAATIYFAGDTAYSSHFAEIGAAFQNAVDVALMPVGPCEPRRFMYNSHMNAEEAGQAFVDIGAQQFIPMHWGTFCFGTDSFDTPIKRLRTWWRSNAAKIKHKTLLTPKMGQAIIIPQGRQEHRKQPYYERY